MSLFRRPGRPRFKKPGVPDERRFRNPYLHPRRRGSRLAGKLGLTAATILGMLAAYIVIFSPAFSILEVSVAGASPANVDLVRKTARDFIDGRRWLIIPRKNTLFVQPSDLAENLRKFPTIETVTVVRDGPHILRVQVTEKEPRYVVLCGPAAFLADKRGAVISRVETAAAEKLSSVLISEFLSATTTLFASATGTLPAAPFLPPQDATGTPRLPVVVISRQKEFRPGDQAARSEALTALESAQAGLEDYGIKILSASLASDEAWEMAARTGEGWQVYLDAGSGLEQQIDSLRAILKSSLRNRDGLQYVDLRYGNRVFYK